MTSSIRPKGVLCGASCSKSGVVLASTAIFFVSILLAPRRGLVVDLVRRVSLRRKIGRQNLLRALYELTEQASAAQAPLAFDAVVAARSWLPGEARRQLARARRQRLVERLGSGFGLTATGREAALRVVRAHRLWETYLIEQAEIAADHVDRDADQLEHILPPELIRHLEDRLREQGRLPRDLPVPPSPHRLSEAGA